MKTLNKTNCTLENHDSIFKWFVFKTRSPIFISSQTVTSLLDDVFAHPLLNSSLQPPHKAFSYSFPQSSRPGNRKCSSARRKPLVVRVVRKASLALIFLTTLPLHPKSLHVWMYLFKFSAGGELMNRYLFLSVGPMKMRSKYVG